MAESMTVNGRTANDVRVGRRGPVGMKRLASWGLLLFVAVCALTGCERGKLLKVERLMESDIDAADTLIYSMDEPCGKRNRALYAMLKTQIDYKQIRTAPNDSTIRIATDYYGKKYKDYHAAMAWYSLGCVTAELGQDSTAADAYLTALALFPDTMVRYYALAEQNLSYIYLDNKMNAEAIQLIKTCRANAIRLKDSAAIAFCDYNLATQYLYERDYDSAQDMFLKLKNCKWLSDNTKDVPLLQLSKILILRDQNYAEAICYADSFIVRNRNQISNGAAYDIKANSYYNLHQLDSALFYYNLAIANSSDPNTICDSYRRLTEIYTIAEKKDSAYFCTTQASAWMDSIASITNSSELVRMLNKKTETEILRYQEMNRYKSMALMLSSIIIFALVTMSVLHRKHDSIVKPTSNAIPESDAIKENIDYDNKQTQSPQQQIETISDYQEEIDAFKQSYLYKRMVEVTHNPANLSSKERTNIAKEFSNSLTELRLFLKSSSSNLNNNDICFCLFIIIGFIQKDFSLFFNISPSGYRNLKLRLKIKLTKPLYDSIFNHKHN